MRRLKMISRLMHTNLHSFVNAASGWKSRPCITCVYSKLTNEELQYHLFYECSPFFIECPYWATKVCGYVYGCWGYRIWSSFHWESFDKFTMLINVSSIVYFEHYLAFYIRELITPNGLKVERVNNPKIKTHV